MDLFFIHNLWIKKEKSKLKLINIIFIIKTINFIKTLTLNNSNFQNNFIINKIDYLYIIIKYK